jgi:peptide/nickel transport system permease protein
MSNEILTLLIKRIAVSFLALFLLVSFLFVLLRISPGNPAQKYISPNFSPELIHQIEKSFNLDKPIITQYKTFLINLSKGELGISYTYRQPVLSVIKEFFPFTLFLFSTAIIIQICLSIILALTAVKRINGKLDKFLSRFTLMLYSTPSFVIGVLLIYIFAEKLGLLPTSGLKSFGIEKLPLHLQLADYINHLILPLATITLGGIAVYYKYLRENLENIYDQTFVLNLRAHGYSEKTITLKHVLPNAVNPLISVAGVEIGMLFSGALITEVIFGLPGMGRLTVQAILSRDFPLVIGCAFTAGVFVIISNLAADLLKAKIDKRLAKGMLN